VSPSQTAAGDDVAIAVGDECGVGVGDGAESAVVANAMARALPIVIATSRQV